MLNDHFYFTSGLITITADVCLSFDKVT